MPEKHPMICKDCGEPIRQERGYFVADPDRGDSGPFCLGCIKKRKGADWIPPVRSESSAGGDP